MAAIGNGRKILFLLCAMCLCLSNLRALELIINGNFETGDLSGWTVEKQSKSAGEWLVYSGYTLPISGSEFYHPPGELHGAAFDQNGPACSVMYQDVKIPKGKASLSFTYYYQDYNKVHALDYNHQPSKHQFRVDLLNPEIDPFSIDSDDILLNAFQLNSKAPPSLNPTTVTYDLTPFSGKKVRLRFAAVNHEGHFKVGVDDISIQVQKKHKKQ